MPDAHVWGRFYELEIGGTGAFFQVMRSTCETCGGELLVVKDREESAHRPVYVPPCSASG